MSAIQDTQQDAIQLLITDHREAERLFTQIEMQSSGGEQREDAIRDVIRELSIHAAIEEQILYPAMRRSLPNGDALVEEAIDEHQQVKEALAAIERAGDTPERDGLLQTLISSVRHHVQEEEGELFSALRAAVGQEELRSMGGKLAAAKKMAPTHPHPNAPNTSPGNVVGGAAAAVMDKARDALRRD